MTMSGSVSVLDSRWSSRPSVKVGGTFGNGAKYGCVNAGNSSRTICFQRPQGGKVRNMTFCQSSWMLNFGWINSGGLDVGKMQVPIRYGLLIHHLLPSMFSSDHGPAQSLRPFMVLKCARDVNANTSDSSVVGEDSASFELEEQKISSWIYFSLTLGVVLLVLNLVWIDNSTGFGKAFIDTVSSLADSPEITMLSLTLIFAIAHSGLASLRDGGEKLIGERAFRVLFAGVSLPLVVSTVVYFINHRYDGIQLWDLQNVSALHHFLWLNNFISFLFLYPSTFNLLEVAAIDKPKMHLWESGIIRITRHPQMVGQVMWCLAHTIWIGNSVAVAASIGLIGHHLFGVWNGDRRLAKRYGEAFEVVKRRTSVIPFAAILDGRQKLPRDYYKEFLRLPYLSITALTLGIYFAHPLIRAASARLHW